MHAHMDTRSHTRTHAHMDAQVLLESGADPNAMDNRGVTACHMAAEVGAVDIVTALVQNGADCTVMAHAAAITPLIVAAAAGEEEMVALLLAITVKVDDLHHDKSAMSALMAAASNGSIPIVQQILEAVCACVHVHGRMCACASPSCSRSSRRYVHVCMGLCA